MLLSTYSPANKELAQQRERIASLESTNPGQVVSEADKAKIAVSLLFHLAFNLLTYSRLQNQLRDSILQLIENEHSDALKDALPHGRLTDVSEGPDGQQITTYHPDWTIGPKQGVNAQFRRHVLDLVADLVKVSSSSNSAEYCRSPGSDRIPTLHANIPLQSFVKPLTNAIQPT